MAGSDSMAKPMWRASSCRMRRQTWRSTASLEDFGQHAEQRDGEGLGDQLQADRLEVPRRGAEQRVEDLPDVAADRIDLAVEAQLEIALQHLVVARLVGHLGRLEQLGVLALHVLDELAAQQHGAMLALHQGRQPPAADAAVELDAVASRKADPRSACRGCRRDRRRSARHRPRAAPSSRCRWRRSTGRSWPARRAGAGPTGRWRSRGESARCYASRPGARCPQRSSVSPCFGGA